MTGWAALAAVAAAVAAIAVVARRGGLTVIVRIWWGGDTPPDKHQ